MSARIWGHLGSRMANKPTTEAIDSELAEIGDLAANRSHPELDLALLRRQFQLLVDRGRILIDRGQHSEALTSATEAISLERALAAHRSDEDPVATILTASALVTLGLARLAEGNDFRKARKSADRARQHLDLVEPASQEDAQLRVTYDRERGRLLELLQNISATVDAAAKSVQVEEDTRFQAAQVNDERRWSATAAELNQLVVEIAERIAQAGALFARVSQPDLFVSWLQTRLAGEVGRTASNTSGFAEPDEESISLVARARDRGRDAMRKIWASEEMVPAGVLMKKDGLPATDEDLRMSRESGIVLWLPNPDEPERYAYPKWQFEVSNLQATRAALKHLNALSPWAKWHFFHTCSTVLSERTPLEVLEEARQFAHNENGKHVPRDEIKKAHALVEQAAIDYVRGAD